MESEKLEGRVEEAKQTVCVVHLLITQSVGCSKSSEGLPRLYYDAPCFAFRRDEGKIQNVKTKKNCTLRQAEARVYIYMDSARPIQFIAEVVF